MDVSFLKDDEIINKYNGILNKVSDNVKKEFNSKSIYKKN